jgi:hypothetical protein
VKLVLFGLLPGDADQDSTGGVFKGQCGFVHRDQRGASWATTRRRLYARVPTASQ